MTTKELIAALKKLRLKAESPTECNCAPECGNEITHIMEGITKLRLMAPALCASVEALAAALDPNQRENGDLVFQVRVSGHGARPHSPKEVALSLIYVWQKATWAEGDPLVRVRLEESTEARATVPDVKEKE